MPADGAAAGADASKPGDANATSDNGDEKKSDEDQEKEEAAKAEREKLLKAGYNPIKAAMFDINQGKPRDAIDKLKTLLDKNPNDVRAHYVLAVGYVRARQYAQAASEYKAVLKLAPPDSKLAAMASEGLKKIAH